MLTDSQTDVSVDRWPSLDASGLLPCTQFTGAGPHWEQIGLSANPLILIGADGVSRCPGHGYTVGGSAAAQRQATCLSLIKLGMKT